MPIIILTSEIESGGLPERHLCVENGLDLEYYFELKF